MKKKKNTKNEELEKNQQLSCQNKLCKLPRREAKAKKKKNLRNERNKASQGERVVGRDKKQELQHFKDIGSGNRGK